MISQLEFLALVLPPLCEGEHYCVFGNIDSDHVRQRFVPTLEGIAEQAVIFGDDNYNVFYGMAKYGAAKNGRFAPNAISLKSFFVDLDCGAGKPYEDLHAGLAALKEFCKKASLPKPTIVKSGRGAHVYWVLNEPIPRQEWKPHAERLKEMCGEFGFEVDPAVTADAARVLRVPETLHVKDPNDKRLVEIMYVAPTVSVSHIKNILTPTEGILKELSRSEFRRPMDAVTLALMGSSEVHFKLIMKKTGQGVGCLQLANAYQNQATLDEPLWRGALSIANLCVDRDDAITKLSSKHPEYNWETANKKAEDTKGPYTCATWKKLNAKLCEGCSHTFTSPIQLGKVIKEAALDDNVVEGVIPETSEVATFIIPQYPWPFFRKQGGGIGMHTKDKDGTKTEEHIYPYDFYAVKRIDDPDHGESIFLKLHLPKDGVREFVLPLSTVMSRDRFRDKIAEKGIAGVGKTQEYLMAYITKWVEELQMTTESEKARKQFGWLDDRSAIVIGDQEIRAAETVYTPPSSSTLPLVPLMRPRGSLDIWKDIVNIYGRPGMENRALPLFMGFGTLFMPFTKLNGFLYNLVSKDSGTGKSTVLQIVNSIYGHPDKLLLAPKDTYNHRLQRIGTLNNLPVTMDEITNMDANIMSDQIYDITSGRAKHRMKQHENAERTNHSTWQTALITTSNRSVTDLLLSIKSFPDGELNRILESKFDFDPLHDPTWSKAHFNRIHDNYGVAGPVWAKFFVGNLPYAMAKYAEVEKRVDAAAKIKSSERFWSMMVTIAITSGILTKELGLHDIDIEPVFEFGIKSIIETRMRNKEYLFDTDEYLGGFLQRHFHEVLVINGERDKRNGLEHAPIREPKGALNVRFEPDTKMLYIVVRAFRDDCNKTQMNYEEALMPYRKTRALVEVKKKRMTAGTVAATQTPVQCLCFDTKKLDFFNEEIIAGNDDLQGASGN